jgi:TonB family protein
MPIKAAYLHNKSQRDLQKIKSIGSLLLCGLVLTGLIGCQEAQRPLTTEERMRAVQIKQEANPDFYLQRKAVDYMSDLREIRDANLAEKKEVSKPQSIAPSSSPSNSAIENKTPDQIASRPAEIEVASAITNTSAPMSRTLPVNTPTQLPSSAVPISEQSAATPLVTAQEKALQKPVASPTASAEAVPEGNMVRVITSVRPNFPREATQRGIQRGNVRAKATINSAGDVTNVDIISASPVGIFNREVINAIQRWKFNAGANNRTFETDIVFQP